MDHYTYSLVEALIHFDVIKTKHEKENHGKRCLDREDAEQLELFIDKGLSHKELVTLVEVELQNRANGRSVGNYRILDSNFNYFNLQAEKHQVTVKVFYHTYIDKYDTECLYCTIREEYLNATHNDNESDIISGNS